MNCEGIKQRDIEKLQNLLGKYNIKETVESLSKYFTSVYLHKDFKQKRVRLLGIKHIHMIGNDGKEHRTKKKKTVQLYVLSKRMIQTLPKQQVFDISHDLSLISFYFEQIKIINEFELLEKNKDTIINMDMLSSSDYEKMNQYIIKTY